MSKLLINIVLFFLGILLAFGFVRHSTPAKLTRPDNAISLAGVKFPSTRLSSSTQLSERRHAETLRGATPERRIRLLENALKGKTEAELQLVQLEELRTLPKYRSVILPRLKHRALEVLLQRFSEPDWRTWTIGALDFNRNPTQARKYVDLLWQINRDIASFTETAAYLLHGMFSSIATGKSYPIRQDLQYLVMNTQEMLSARKSAARQGDSAFDSAILGEPSVYLSFEKIRAELTKQFIREHPYQREAHFTLLLDLDPRAYDKSLRESLKRALQNLSLNASSEYRAEILPAVVDSRLLSLVATEDTKVARSLAQLYLVGSVDAIEAGRLKLAHRLLLRSESTYGGLEAQRVLAKFITEQSKIEVAPAPKRSSEVSRVTSKRKPEEAEGGIGWATIFLILLLGIGVIYGLRVIWDRRSAILVSGGLGQNKKTRSPTPPPKTVVSDPSSLGFDSDPLDADIDFDMSETVNS